MTFFSDTNRKIQYGLSENNDHYCLVHIENGEPSVRFQPKPFEIKALLPTKTQLVVAQPAHTIWRKTVFLPDNLPTHTVHQQIIQLLQQSLPIPLENLQFDYHIQPLDQALKITVFALRKQEVIPASDVCPMIDCQWHCISRALLFLHHIPFEHYAEYSYHIDEHYLYLEHDEWRISKTAPEHLPCLENPTSDTEILDLTLYLNALGAALWEEQRGFPAICLNGKRQNSWLNQSVRHLALWVGTACSSVLLAAVILLINQPVAQHNRQLTQDIQHLQQKQQATMEKIDTLKQAHLAQRHEQPFSPQQITAFLDLLNRLRLNGGLELAQLSMQEQSLVTLAGRITPTAFTELESTLKQHDYRYHIVHLQTGEQAEMEFSLNIEWGK